MATQTSGLTDICVRWSDFQQNRYITADVQWGERIGSPEDRDVFNGVERTIRQHCTVNGEPKIAVTTQFYPSFGHASYGSIFFE